MPTITGTTIGISDGRIISRWADRVTMSTHWPYSGFSVPSMIPGFSRNCRRTSSTTARPARPTASIERAANSVTIMPPMIRPISTSGLSSSNVMTSADSPAAARS